VSLVSLLILDVDGVLTDGSLPFGEVGTAAKTFFVGDGSAIKMWRDAGGRAALLSGRESPAVAARARELGIDAVIQGASDKLAAYESLCGKLGVADAAVCYVGDDLPDLPPMRRCGLPVAVANAHPAVKRVAAYVTRRSGGRGAAAEVVERLLRATGRWDELLTKAGG
jgi:3-deoxy-D-manno-octulosonate 8-phosphate phosphatase (KDO 8-P phosphatase)